MFLRSSQEWLFFKKKKVHNVHDNIKNVWNFKDVRANGSISPCGPYVDGSLQEIYASRDKISKVFIC